MLRITRIPFRKRLAEWNQQIDAKLLTQKATRIDRSVCIGWATTAGLTSSAGHQKRDDRQHQGNADHEIDYPLAPASGHNLK